MARILTMSAAGFDQQLDGLLHQKREMSQDVDADVAAILRAVQQEGDQAVLRYTAQLDRLELTPQTLAVPVQERDAAAAICRSDEIAALTMAAERIQSYHTKQMPDDMRYTDAQGVTLGWRWSALDSVGLYVPGGLASYPSSVLMNAIPARVAGVERLVMVVPAPDGVLNPLVLAAAKLAGISEIYKIGGAQAIGALAFGTQTIAPVDKIVGPGNAYVAAAKRRVFGHVGIDSIAGPSEILVVADNKTPVAWTACDLLSQAEHDVSSQSILITDDPHYAQEVCTEVDAQLKKLARAEIAGAAWRHNSAIITVPHLVADAVGVINRIAPEHLQLSVDDPEKFLPAIRHAGAIFLGRYTPEAIGDYVAGPDHVLPTARAARFASGLSVLDFLKRSSLISCTPQALQEIGPAAVTLAQSEGLLAHARSVSCRLTEE